MSTAATVRIIETLFRDNASRIFVDGGANAIISKVTVLGSNEGFYFLSLAAGTTIIAAISDSVFSGNGYGVYEFSASGGGNVRFSVSRSQFSNNSYGINSEANPSAGTVAVTVSENIVTQNTIGIRQLGTTATLESLRNNTVRQNTTNSTGIINSVSQL